MVLYGDDSGGDDDSGGGDDSGGDGVEVVLLCCTMLCMYICMYVDNGYPPLQTSSEMPHTRIHCSFFCDHPIQDYQRLNEKHLSGAC